MDKSQLIERIKGMSKEEKTLFQEAFREAETPEPKTEASLSVEEVSQFREMLALFNEKKTGGKKGKDKGVLAKLDSLFE